MNSKRLFFAGLAFLFIAGLEIIPFFTKSTVPTAEKDEDSVEEVKALELWQSRYDENRSYHAYWGFPTPEDGMQGLLEADANATGAVTVVEKKENSNVLCIADSCYRLLGIKKRADKFVAVLYNAKFKDRIVELHAGDLLEANISIKEVEPLGVRFSDGMSDRQWRFDMFDVNSTKYIPKEIDEN